MLRKNLIISCVLLVGTGFSSAATTYAELTGGDLSNNSASPTFLDFSPGNNIVGGNMGIATTLDPDFFSFTVEPGESLTSISLLSYVPSGSARSGSFFAIAFGSTINTGNGATHAANKLINGSSGELLTTGNLLGNKLSGGASTLTNPIGPGTYTAWFQETATTVDYRLQFTMVPEPTTAVLGMVAMGLFLRRKR